ncbi:MAG: outer membrane beta-barrel protein [Bacteroidales bacterium]|nr:outer membrane beta-barrel protein [Bacteroidales bacterium]MDY0216703.1 outer membrane beta-barrel protein [Bacteroidales bacterium]
MRKALNIILVCLFLTGISSELSAQKWKKNRSFLTVHLGGSNFLGELGGSPDIGTFGLKDFDIQSTRMMLGAGYSYRIAERLNIKANGYFGWIGGDDAHTSQINRNARNLHFRSILAEVSGQLELYLTVQNTGPQWGRRRTSRMPVTTYIFAGVGGVYTNPKAKYTDGSWHALQPLGTEGQGLVETRKPYSRIAMSFPYGIGLKYEINRRYHLGIEYGIRLTTTDYMDDVSTTYFDVNKIRAERGDIAAYFSNPSDPTDPVAFNGTSPGNQRGNPVNNDSYMFAQFTLYVNLYKIRTNICSFQY